MTSAQRGRFRCALSSFPFFKKKGVFLFYAHFFVSLHSLCHRNSHRFANGTPRYKVTIHNDDFTPMDFVVKVLTQVFFKQPAEAEQLMLQVHHSDKAVVGIYTYDIAVSKVRKATMMARKEGFPLRLTYEPD